MGGKVNKLEPLQLIISIGFSLIVAPPIAGFMCVFIAHFLFFLSLDSLSLSSYIDCVIWIFWCGAIGGGLLVLILSIRYFKNSDLKPSSSEKRKNDEKAKRY